MATANIKNSEAPSQINVKADAEGLFTSVSVPITQHIMPGKIYKLHQKAG